MKISSILRFFWLFYFSLNLAFCKNVDSELKTTEDDTENVEEDIITMFTVATTDTGSTWKALPFREKFQFQSQDAPCRPFKLRIPDERKNHEQIELCIFRPTLDSSNDLDTFVHALDSHYDVYEQREMQIQGFVKGKERSVVSGRMVDKLFYGEVSFYDTELDTLIVYEVEEISLLTKLMRHDKKVLHSLLYVMNKGDKSTVVFNAVVTLGVSLLTFITNDRPKDSTPRSFLIFSTSHNSYIAPGEADIKVDELGRLNFEVIPVTLPNHSTPKKITIDSDGSVLLLTEHKEYKFRPNGQTIVTKGKQVQTLQEHEGAVAVMAFTKSITYDCVLPPPSFRPSRKGGFLCRVCLLVDKSFQQFYKSENNQSVIESLNNVIDRVSWIFRAVDWNKDNVPDNIGLEYDSQVRQWDPPNVATDEFITNDVLAVIFTTLSQMDFSECCLAIAYTMKAFPKTVYAKSSLVSQTMMPSGICALRSQGLSSNVILISANSKEGNYNTLPADKLIYLTAHQVAKAFGAPLDATGKEICDQFHDEKKQVRHFIMWPDVLRNSTEEEKKFSSCTINVVHDSLVGCRTACFETNHHPFCGNGLVEEGEECDCGSAHSCSKQLCCYARSGKYPCRKTGVPCSSSADLKIFNLMTFLLFSLLHFYYIL